MNHKIGYSKTWAIVLLSLGSLSIIATFFASEMNGHVLFLGGVGLLVGLSYLKNTYFEVLDGELVQKAPIGAVKRYPFKTGELVVKDEGIFVAGEKLGFSRLLADNKDWDELKRLCSLQQKEDVEQPI